MSEAASSGGTLMFFTNTYPFAPGEEFIESEIEHLAARFERVFVIPAFPNREARRRAMPANVELVVPESLDASRSAPREALGYAARHPLRALASAARALRSFPRLAAMFDDLRLDLLASILTDNVLERVRDALATGAPTVFYSYWMMAPARAAVELRKRLSAQHVPLVSRAHGYDVFSERQASNHLPQRELLFREFSRVFTASENGAQYLRAKYPLHADRIAVGHLGVGPAIAPGNAVRECLRVYTCAYLVPVKRIPLLIQALAVAQTHGLAVTWSHIGGGPDGYAAEIESLAQQTLTSGSYEFLGNLTNEQVREQYARQPGAVFVNVSESEGVPVSIMEALAQGMPVIATDVGGNSELIDVDGGMFDGILGSSPTPEQIADRLEKLMSADDDRYSGFVQASLRHWKISWSSDENYSEFSHDLRSHAVPL